MENKAEKIVNDLLTKCSEIGLNEKMAINCSIIHVNQVLFEQNTSQKQLLYKNVLSILTDMEKKCIIEWDLYHEANKTAIVIKTYNYKDLITINKDKKAGKPCIRDTRISVMDVLSYLSNGMSHKEIMDDFPELTKDDINACLEYANQILNYLFTNGK
jgi:uncharacterized protein (DUF433 family)